MRRIPTPSATAAPARRRSRGALGLAIVTFALTSTVSALGIADLIFADGFESGDTSAWSNVVTPERVEVTAAPAGLPGRYSMALHLGFTPAAFVEDESPAGEKRYRARFLLDRTQLTLPDSNGFLLFGGYDATNTRQFDVRLRKEPFSQGFYDLRFRALQDNGSWSPWLELSTTDLSFPVEVEWRAASAPGANDGSLRAWVGTAQSGAVEGLDNDLATIERARLGAPVGLNTNVISGNLLFDGFESWRSGGATD